MTLEIIHLILGPLGNNVYLLGDHTSGDAVVIDPSFESRAVLDQAETLGWTLRGIWLTHGHFDHLAGAGEIARAFTPHLPVGLHPDDLAWYRQEGGAGQFGMSISPLPQETSPLTHGTPLGLRADLPPVAEVRHAPGHSAGHVMFYVERLGTLFCGDVIFYQGIGRTDLAGGDLETLLESIRAQVFSLPDETRLLPGHGPETTVGFERANNPFL
ncbi:MAG: MBL fold metallo-hydrolase [Chloroflexi bacterium]|jgi:glyoxylase-like metal-dependent hydrolase (beta-lactamase superfamily II)|nr:MBL fold metallo-hydrolase [Chloroflexota bacterium]